MAADRDDGTQREEAAKGEWELHRVVGSVSKPHAQAATRFDVLVSG